MNTTSLKIIALLFMLIDHMALFIPFTPTFFHYIGRLAAPIFIFCTVVGFNYSRRKKDYLLRLYFLCVFMGIILLFVNYPFGKEYRQITTDFPRTLFTICVFIYLFYYSPIEKRSKLVSLYLLWQLITIILIILLLNFTNLSEEFLVYTVPNLLGSILNLEGGLLFVTLGLLISSLRNTKVKLSIYYINFILIFVLIDIFKIVPLFIGLFRRAGLCLVGDIITFISYAIIGINPMLFTNSSNGFSLFDNYQWLMLFALPFMLAYNQQKGRNLKYFFYIFYPTHIVFLYFIGNYIYNSF
ncbi:TraX family protein [Proteinivorax tanatarense]|uniref:TraX family protein n=1 Tax=Proteinivorax tanatarense TaxID=1260629 RepID=A0AAU7VMB5_9FIRM